MTTSAGWPKGAMTSIAGAYGWNGSEIRFHPGANAIGTAGNVICSTPVEASSPSLHDAPSAEASNAASATASIMDRAVLPFIQLIMTRLQCVGAVQWDSVAQALYGVGGSQSGRPERMAAKR